MSTPILATKLYVPPPRSRIVLRPRLIERLNEGLYCKLTLISAPAGFGKTTLVSEWLANCGRPAAWLSLDEGDNDPTRFLTYLVAAMQTVAAGVGEEMLSVLQSPHPPPINSILTALLNEIAAAGESFALVLDDYHAIDVQPVGAPGSIDDVLTFLLEHLPSSMRLVIATREDPDLPLARLRARGELAELRANDLRFTPAEAADFLNRVMGLSLSAKDIDALEARTEGWIVGLQLAALSMQGHQDIAGFIKSFTGSHHFVLDYLVEEVLQQQPESVQAFLLRTSILDRLCGPLCDAVVPDRAVSGQATLEHLERSNLFIVPLDNERCWYRYHHLFGDLLRQRLGQSFTREEIDQYRIRASQWCEANGLVLEAFQYAARANDVERAERLVESKEMPLHLRSVATVVLGWLASLPALVLDVRPALWVKSAALALMAGQTTGVEEKLQAAEKTLQDTKLDDTTRHLIGKIACARATLALTRYDPESMIIQAHRALEYLPSSDLAFRFTANWALANACLLQGDRATAAQACMEGVSISRQSGDVFSIMLATSDLGQLQELANQLHPAAETYQHVLQLAGDHPHPNVGEVQLGLARICYEWNDLEAAERYGQQSLQLVRLYDRVIDRFIVSEVFLARLKLARGDVVGTAAQLAQAEQAARQRNFLPRLPEIAAAQVPVLLRQGNLLAAARLAEQFDLPLSQSRVLMAQGNPSAALVVLEAFRQQMEARGWADELLKTMVLQAVALQADGENDEALQLLSGTLALAEPGGFIRLFVDEGLPMAQLLSEAAAQGIMPTYVDKLVAAFEAEPQQSTDQSELSPAQPLAEPLSVRELEVLRLIAQGLSNQQIGERLFLALDTVKGHNRRIFDKLQVERRTEAIARARELGLL